MSNLKTAALELAKKDPKFREALRAQLRTAAEEMDEEEWAKVHQKMANIMASKLKDGKTHSFWASTVSLPRDVGHGMYWQFGTQMFPKGKNAYLSIYTPMFSRVDRSQWSGLYMDLGDVLRKAERVLKPFGKVKFNIADKATQLWLDLAPGKDKEVEKVLLSLTKRLADVTDRFVKHEAKKSKTAALNHEILSMIAQTRPRPVDSLSAWQQRQADVLADKGLLKKGPTPRSGIAYWPTQKGLDALGKRASSDYGVLSLSGDRKGLLMTLGRLASSFAAKAFARGERHGGPGNATTYPRKWYREVERKLGKKAPLIDAKMWSYFNDVYDANLAQLTHSVQNPKDMRRLPMPDFKKYMASKTAATTRLIPSLKRAINKDLNKAGLDGNGRFRKPEEAYSRALEVLAEYGIELDEVVSSHLFKGDKGSLTIDVAFTNPQDSFSPDSISNSVLRLDFTNLGNRYEVIGYMS